MYVTVDDFLDLISDCGVAHGYRIYDFATSKNVYDSNEDTSEYYDDNDEWCDYESCKF